MRLKWKFHTAILCVALAPFAARATAIIQYEITQVDPIASLNRYTYYVSGMDFRVNQELDIQFSAELFGVLSNGMAPADFDLLLFQPGNPVGSPGHFTAFALNDVAAPLQFSVDFSYLGAGRPGAQAFVINEYDADGYFVGEVDSGLTSLRGSTAVPEPDCFSTAGLALALCGWAALRRRRAPGGLD